ncbi:MAG TPA: tetratricopeptide repeat protein [Polyangiaceae bacterium]|nr:tetratricopeptide repeat protein [Polyangiaceae bacterium]
MAAPIRAQTPIHGADGARGAAAFDRGQAAWARGDFDVAESQLKDAIDQGGLTRKDVLKAYIYLGSARAVLGQRTGAIAAFRVAATLDPSFKVPAEAGKKVAHVADAAKKERFLPPWLRADVPSDVDANRPFQVEVSLGSPVSPAHGAGIVISRVSLEVSDGLATSASYKTDAAAGPRVHFDVPATATASRASAPKANLSGPASPKADLLVRVSGLDAHGNELVTSESQVHVAPEVQGPTPLDPSAVARTSPQKTVPTAAHASAGLANLGTDNALHSGSTHSDRGASGGGFWSTPWPYILGGALLAGAGVGGYFLLRPADHVTVTSVQVQAIR